MNKLFIIKNKTSSSPSIIIENYNVKPPTVLKLWKEAKHIPNEADNIFYKSLEYEKTMYGKTILPIIKEIEENKEKFPLFLNYVGEGNCTTVRDIAKYLGVDNDDDKNRLDLCLLVYWNDPYTPTNYEKLKLRSNTRIPDEDLENLYNTYTFNCIITPYIQSKSFMGCLNKYTCTTEEIIFMFQQIIKGLTYLYKNGGVHNDLHAGNILIGEHNFVYLFDWDRGYVEALGPNPMLDTSICGGTSYCCNYAQCNRYENDGYCIDFYKILYNILFLRKNDYSLILDGIGISNKQIGMTTLHDLIYDTIFTQNNNNGSFFEISDGSKICNWLQDRTIPKNGLTIGFIHDIIGTINEIGINMPKIQDDEEPDSDSDTSSGSSVEYDKVAAAITELFSPKAKSKFGLVAVQNTLHRQSSSQDKLKKLRPPQSSAKMMGNDAKILTFHKTKTWKTVAELRKQLNDSKYGPSIEGKTGRTKITKSKEVKVVPITDIMCKNEERKAELRERFLAKMKNNIKL